MIASRQLTSYIAEQVQNGTNIASTSLKEGVQGFVLAGCAARSTSTVQYKYIICALE